MDIKEKALSQIKNAGSGAVGHTVLQKVKLFCWETGLGPALNALPSVFGQQAVLYFPGRSGKYALPCFEREGKVLAAVTAGELQSLSEQLLQSPGVEIWLKNGWYAGTARLLSPEEQEEAMAAVTEKRFFGEAGSAVQKHRHEEYRLIEVTRSAPCTGEKGPGSRAWIWPAAAAVLFLSGKKKK